MSRDPFEYKEEQIIHLLSPHNHLNMGMNKNSVFAWASFCTMLVGIALILLGVLNILIMLLGFPPLGLVFLFCLGLLMH